MAFKNLNFIEKVLVIPSQKQPLFLRFFEWGKLLVLTSSAQVSIQAIGFVCGILVIRLLPTQEYALYTLANTMLGTITVLADGGIATGVLSEGGKVWKDKEKLGAVLVTGMDLRKKFAVGSLFVATPALIFLLRHHEASWLMTIMLALSLIPAFLSNLTGAIYNIPLLLKQDIVPLQKNQVGVNIGRLGILLLTLFAFPWAFIAILATGLPQIYANIRLRKISSAYSNWQQNTNPAIRKEILFFVKRLLPGSIYYCISSQITIWLISFFGSTEAVAQVGGLSRIAMLLNLFNIIFGTLIVPRFSRLPKSRMKILRNFFLIQIGLIILIVLLIVFVRQFSTSILWVLGEGFSSLTTEMLLITIGSCFALVSTCTHQLLSSRGIIVPPIQFILIIVGIQFGIAFFLQLDNVIGVLMFGIYTSLTIYIIRLIYLFIILKKNATI